MQNKITFFLEIDPHPQERIRFHFSGWGKRRKISPYLPEKTKVFQNTVRSMVRQFMADNDLPEYAKLTPIAMEVIFYLKRPKAMPKGRLGPIVRPDLSNYLKAVEDGLQRAAKDDDAPAMFEDDSAICSIYCEKRYVDEDNPTPGCLVTVYQYDPSNPNAE